jgi:hypothetical protein
MALHLAIGAWLAPVLRRAMTRGRRALLRSAALGGLLVVGTALVLVSVVLALSSWIGPIAATGISGVVLLLVAGIVAAATRRRRDPPVLPAAGPKADGLSHGGLLLPGLGLVLGLALAGVLFRKSR